MKKIYAVMLFFVAIGWIQPILAQELHPKGKFNFLRGREAFNKRDYSTALTEFRAYVALDDKNHQALNMLAQTYHQLKDITQAQNYYKKSIEVAPDKYTGIYKFNLGVLYFDLKKFNDALPLLTDAADKMPSLPEEFSEKKGLAYYYKAFIYYEREQWGDAKFNFEKSTHYSVDLRQGAWFYHAICDYKLGNIENSVDRFKVAEGLGTSKALTNYARQFIDRLQGYQPKSRFGFTSGLQGTYDTNVVLEPDEGPSHTIITDEKGSQVALLVEPSYTAPVGELNFRSKYNFSVGRQLESKHKSFNYFNHRGDLIFSKDFEGSHGNRLSFDTQFNALRNKDHDQIRTSVGETIGYVRGWNETYTTDFQLGVGWAGHPDPETRNNERDGVTYTLAGLNYWNIPDFKLKLTGGLGGSLADTRGDAFDHIGFMGTVGGNYAIAEAANFDLTFRADRQKFRGRITQTQTTTAGVFKKWTDQISSGLNYSYIDGYGDTGTAFDYTRHLVSLSLYHQI